MLNLNDIFEILSIFLNLSIIMNNINLKISYCYFLNSILTCLINLNLFLNNYFKNFICQKIIYWITNDLKEDILKLFLTSINLLLNNLSFINTFNDENKAIESFLLYFNFIKFLNNSNNFSNILLDILNSLFKSNIFIALKYSISLSFSKNSIIRSTIINLFSNYFNQENFNNYLIMNSNEDKLINLIIFNDFEIIKPLINLINHNYYDEFSFLLLELSIYKGIEIQLIQKMINIEIETSNKNTLFRNNSISSKIISIFPKLIGGKWLKETLLPLILEIIERVNKGERFQIDNDKIQNNEILNINQQSFKNLVSYSINLIFESLKNIPPSLLLVSKMIYQSLQKDSIELSIQSISGFLFLRFICPSLSMPKNLGFQENISEEVHLCLIHLSVIINISSNKPTIDSKRPYLKFFENLIINLNEKFLNFYQRIINMNLFNISSNNTLTISDLRLNINNLFYNIF